MLWFLMNINLILIIAAAAPAIYLLVKVYQYDRLEPESPGLLATLVLYGALSTIIAMIVEGGGSFLVGAIAGRNYTLYNILLYFGVVAFGEEGAKYWVLKRKTWNHPEFDCQFDGVVYAVFVSLGFALLENIKYVFNYGLGTAIIRAITAVPGHACFGIFMGIFYGIAKRYEREGNEAAASHYKKLAVVVPALLHGFYDYIATSNGLSIIFVVFVIAMFVWANKLIKQASASDSFI